MAAKFARERMVQIFKDDAYFKPSTVVHIKSLFFIYLFFFCFAFHYEENCDTAAHWLGLFLASA